MKCFNLVIVLFAMLSLSACAAHQSSISYAEGAGAKHKSTRIAIDEDYVMQVERAAQYQRVKVIWVNPPIVRVAVKSTADQPDEN